MPAVPRRSAIDRSALDRAFAARESWALEALYAEHARTFYSAAYSVLRNAEDAQDCVHDVLLRLWRNTQSFSPERGALKTFVAVCIRNEAVSRVRMRSKGPELERRLLRRAVEEPAPDPFSAFDPVAQNRLNEAIADLPEAQRSVIILSYFEHLTHREIAERLGEPLGTIKSRLSSALHRLSARLNREYEYE